jgi:aspartyl-tRNA(Asn)/glutamyl-tRNA(Gln) amidotransferase subunit A
MKPTMGTVPQHSPDSFGASVFIGPMTRTVADAALMLQVMAGPHPDDVHSIGRRPQDLMAAAAEPADVSGMRIAWRPLLGNQIIDSGVAALVESAARSFEQQGAEVTLVDHAFETPEPFWRVLNQASWRTRFGGYAAEWGDRMTPSFLRTISEAESYPAEEMQRAMYQRTALFRQVQSWFDEFDLVLTPVITRTALETERDLYDPVIIEAAMPASSGRTGTPTLTLST